MRKVETATSTTLDIVGVEELGIALNLMDPLALVLFDRDIAHEGDVPEGPMRVQINHDPDKRAGSYVAGWFYVCGERFLYQLMVMPGSEKGGQWIRNPRVTIFNQNQRIP